MGSIAEVIEELKKDPGRSARNIGRATGRKDYEVHTILKKLTKTRESDIIRLLAKRKALMQGGTKLLQLLSKEPGISYRKIAIELRAYGEKEKIRIKPQQELLQGLIEYCKRYKDEEVKRILLRHKRAGGLMP